MADEKTNNEDAQSQQDEKVYPPSKKVIPVMAGIYLAVFLVALLGTKQASSFHSAHFNYLFGRIYKYYSPKWVLIVLVAIFEIGSILCAATPTSNGLIVGRVIQGIGGVGIFSGGFMLVSLLVPLQSRPKYTGGLGAVFGIASIVGPILGGYLTAITWRWCFWINLPFGAVSFVLLLFVTPKCPAPEKPAGTFLGKLGQLDPIGFLLVGPATICLLLALQWGGTDYPWKDGRIIALFVVFGVFGLAFVVSQVLLKDKASIPPRVLKQRTVLSACFSQLGIGSLLVIYAFYLPIWFQVIQGKSPEDSGLSLLPLLLSQVVAVIGGGICTSAFGYYTPLLIIGSAILIVAPPLITTWGPNIGPPIWIGYQVVAGFGLGLVLQQPFIAAQTVLPDSELSTGIAVLNFIGFLAGTVFVTVCQTLLENSLFTGLQDIIPNLDASTLTNGGATAIRNMVGEDQLSAVLDIYNDSMRPIWYLALGLSCSILVASFGFEWKSVKKDKKKTETAIAV